MTSNKYNKKLTLKLRKKQKLPKFIVKPCKILLVIKLTTKKITKTEIVRRMLKKYEVSLDKLNYDAIKEFKEKMKDLSDTRQKGKRKYKIWDIVVVVFLAVLGNCNSWEEIKIFAESKKTWLKSFLKLSGGIPSAITYKRVFSIIKPEELENICVLFAQDVLKIFASKRDIMNIDGKTDNGSNRNETEVREKVKALNVLNVYSNNLGICVASQMIEDKTNEIPTIPLILDKINVKGNIITWDALNTQKTNIETVIKLKGDYVVPIKQNQGTFYDDLILYFDEKTLEYIKAGNSISSYKKQIEKNGSNVIVYEYFQTEDISWFKDLKKWKGLKSFGLVKKTIITKGKSNVENRFYISSLYNDIDTFSNAIRLHWSVENKLHWHIDFTFKQDDNSTMDKNALFNLQILKKLSLAFLNDVKRVYNTSLKNIRFRLSLDYETEILRFFNILAH